MVAAAGAAFLESRPFSKGFQIAVDYCGGIVGSFSWGWQGADIVERGKLSGFEVEVGRGRVWQWGLARRVVLAVVIDGWPWLTEVGFIVRRPGLYNHRQRTRRWFDTGAARLGILVLETLGYRRHRVVRRVADEIIVSPFDAGRLSFR